MTLERFNELSHIAFPFKEDTLLMGSDMSGDITLPNDFLLDLQIVIYSRGEGRLELDSIAVAGDGSNAIVTFNYVPDVGASFSLPLTAPVTGIPYHASVWSDDADLSAWFGSGVATICSNSGNFGRTFHFSHPYVEQSCVFVRNNHLVSSLDSPSYVQLSGDVRVWSGYNMQITFTTGDNALRFSAILKEGEGIPCQRILPVPNNCDNIVYRINGMSPDWTGDFILEGGPGLIITGDPANHKIIIKTAYKACSPGCTDDLVN